MPKPKPINAEDFGFPCPFCGAFLGYSLDHLGVIHGLPMCEKFNAFDNPIDFLQAVYKERNKN